MQALPTALGPCRINYCKEQNDCFRERIILLGTKFQVDGSIPTSSKELSAVW